MGRLALVFAGQGSQRVGMGRDLFATSPTAREVFDQAEAAWPGLQALCFEGPQDALNQTINTQPCLFVTDLACAAAVTQAGVQVDGAAGFSLGEVAAASFVGLLSQADGLEFVRQRAKAMDACGKEIPLLRRGGGEADGVVKSEAPTGTMLAVLGLDRPTVEAVAASVDRAWPVNYNCPGQIAVACATDSVDDLAQAVKAAGGKSMRLAVSGAFHTPMMDDAAAELAQLTARMEFGNPNMPLYANLTAKPYGDPKVLLAQQVNHPVRWQDTIEQMISDGFDRFVEVGPGTTLSGFIRRIDADVQVLNVLDAASQAVAIPLLRRGGRPEGSDGVVSGGLEAKTTPALRATPPKEGNLLGLDGRHAVATDGRPAGSDGLERSAGPIPLLRRGGRPAGSDGVVSGGLEAKTTPALRATPPKEGNLLGLFGRHAVVTGGSRGIGRAVAVALAQQGADVSIIYAGQADAADQACAEASSFGVSAKAYQCDVSDWEQTKTVCETIVADHGRVDILVNNAGIVKDGLMMRMTEADFDRVIAVNLKGAFNITRHLLRSLLASPCGRIITVSSVVAEMGNVGQTNYAAAKAGLIGFTKSLAREVAGRGVTCNIIAPGFIETDMTAKLSDSVVANLAGMIPLKHMGTPADVAGAAVYLASDLAAYVTGEVLAVDGGMWM